MTSRGGIGLLCCFVLFLSAEAGLQADEAGIGYFRDMLEDAGFPENDETRRLVSDALMADSYSAVETEFKINRQMSDGRLVQFETRKAATDWYLIFRSQRGEEPRETYPLWGRGTWIIKKDLLTGAFLQAKIFLQDEEFSFVRIYPAGNERCRLDVHLYGRQLGDDVIIPVSFEELMLSPFARITALTGSSMNWKMVFPDPDSYGYRTVENLVSTLRPFADDIVEVDDASVSGGGLNVFIESGQPVMPGMATRSGGRIEQGQTGLNCTGYVKWVVDGIYSTWAGNPGSGYLDMEGLRNPTFRGSRNPWSNSRSAAGDDARRKLDALLRDPWFGLDWNRNLARKVEETRLRRKLSDEEARVLDTGELAGIPYILDMGYNLDDLPSALYQLASRRPGSVYLAAVNSRFLPEPTPEDPNPVALHQYWHVSVLAPWFSDGSGGGESAQRGQFRVAVMDVGDVSESLLPDPRYGTEPRFPAAIRANAVRYARLGNDDSGKALIPEVMVHLIRLDVPPDFVPSPLPEAG
jgi:hypothetical protein